MEEEYSNNKKKKHHLLDVILIIIIIILVLLLLWLWFRISKVEKKVPNNSQGDIFEITCNCDKDSAVGGTNNSDDINSEVCDSNSYFPPSSSVGSSFEENQTDISIPSSSLEVSDNDIIWQDASKLRIFSNPIYQMDEVIAPGSSNEYHFTIKNKAGCDLKYELIFAEENESHINMKYRIKRNGQYLVSDYVSISEVSKVVNKLPSGKRDDYSLEWKWFEGSNDTEVGSKIDAFYQLSVDIIGKQVM